MTNEKMEQRLAAALEKTAPDDVNGVLSRCEERKGTVIPMTTKKTANRKWTSLIGAAPGQRGLPMRLAAARARRRPVRTPVWEWRPIPPR